MFVRVLLTREQERPGARNRKLPPEGLNGTFGQLLPQRRGLSVNPEAGLRDDLDQVLEVFRRCELDLLLFGPPHVMRPKQAINPRGELDPRAWICSDKPISDRYVQRATQYTVLLVHGRHLHQVLLNNPLSGLNLYALLESLAPGAARRSRALAASLTPATGSCIGWYIPPQFRL
jgi:hypothetical protein